MHSAVQRISDLASTDALTGLLNLRAFEEVLQQEHRKAERFGRPYTVLIVDVDNLAQVNETAGTRSGQSDPRRGRRRHHSLDPQLRRAPRASAATNSSCCWSKPTAATGAAIAQRIRNNVYAGTVSVANRLIRANVSVGIANFPEDHLYPEGTDDPRRSAHAAGSGAAAAAGGLTSPANRQLASTALRAVARQSPHLTVSVGCQSERRPRARAPPRPGCRPSSRASAAR